LEKICIDTDVLIDIARKRLIGYVSKELGIHLTSITLYEFLKGLAYIGRDIATSKDELESRFNILWLTNDVILKASGIFCKLKKRGYLIPDPDLLIGSTCIVYNVPLATYNTKHFEKLKQYGLTLEKPERVIGLLERVKHSHNTMIDRILQVVARAR